MFIRWEFHRKGGENDIKVDCKGMYLGLMHASLIVSIKATAATAAILLRTLTAWLILLSKCCSSHFIRGSILKCLSSRRTFLSSIFDCRSNTDKLFC